MWPALLLAKASAVGLRPRLRTRGSFPESVIAASHDASLA